MTSLRDQFPIFAAQPAPFHYLDNAATGQICRAAADALWQFETTARANVKRGVYRLADAATTAFQQARAQVAAYVGAAAADEIVFTSGCTLAINTAAHALAPRLRPGDEILVSELEHHSNLVPWQMAAQQAGAVVRAIPVTAEGRLAYGRLEELVSRRTRVIAVTHASNVTGALTEVGRLREAADAVGALLLLDGAQRAPHGPLDVQALGCDLYAFSAHKMFGPTGAGALWVRRELLAELPPFLGGGEMIRRVTIEESTYAAPPHRLERRCRGGPRCRFRRLRPARTAAGGRVAVRDDGQRFRAHLRGAGPCHRPRDAKDGPRQGDVHPRRAAALRQGPLDRAKRPHDHLDH